MLSRAVTNGMPSSPGVLHLPQDDVMISEADVSGIRHAADRWVSEMLWQYTAGCFHGKSNANATVLREVLLCPC